MKYLINVLFLFSTLHSITTLCMELKKSVGSLTDSSPDYISPSGGDLRLLGFSSRSRSSQEVSPPASSFFAGLLQGQHITNSANSQELLGKDKALSGNLGLIKINSESEISLDNDPLLKDFILLPEEQSAIQQLTYLSTYCHLQGKECRDAVYIAICFLHMRLRKSEESAPKHYAHKLSTIMGYLEAARTATVISEHQAEDVDFAQVITALQALNQPTFATSNTNEQKSVNNFANTNLAAARTIANAFLEILRLYSPLTSEFFKERRYAENPQQKIARAVTDDIAWLSIELAEILIACDKIFPSLLQVTELSVSDLKKDPFFIYVLEKQFPSEEILVQDDTNMLLEALLKLLAQKSVLHEYYQEEANKDSGKKTVFLANSNHKDKEPLEYSEAQNSVEKEISLLTKHIESLILQNELLINKLIIYCSKPCNSHFLALLKFIIDEQILELINGTEIDNQSDQAVLRLLKKMLRTITDLDYIIDQKDCWHITVDNKQITRGIEFREYFMQKRASLAQMLLKLLADKVHLLENLRDSMPLLLSMEPLCDLFLLCNIEAHYTLADSWGQDLWRLLVSKAGFYESRLKEVAHQQFLNEPDIQELRLTPQEFALREKAFNHKILIEIERLQKEINKLTTSVVLLALKARHLVDFTLLKVSALRKNKTLLYILVKKIMNDMTAVISIDDIKIIINELLFLGDTIRSTLTQQKDYFFEQSLRQQLEDKNVEMENAQKTLTMLQKRLKNKESEKIVRKQQVEAILRDKPLLARHFNEFWATGVHNYSSLKIDDEFQEINEYLYSCALDFEKLLNFAKHTYTEENSRETEPLALLLCKSLLYETNAIRESILFNESIFAELEKEKTHYLNSIDHNRENLKLAQQDLKHIGCALRVLDSKFPRLLHPAVLDAYPIPVSLKSSWLEPF